MRLKQILLGLLLVVVVGVGLTLAWQASGRRHKESHPSVSSVAHKRICVAQYVSHPLLDAVYSGFLEELTRSHYDLSDLTFANANNDRNAAQILADQLCHDRCDLIFVLATPMAQSVKAACPATQEILFGAITDPLTAGLVRTMTAPGANLTGTSDQWPYALQMELIAQLWGKGTRVGVPFNPAEANTQYAMEQTRSAAKATGLTLVEVPVTSLAEATQAVDALVGRVEVIYLPADNTVIAAAPAVVAAADRKSIPVVAGDPGTFKAGAVVGLGVSYKNLGVLNAQQAQRILAGEKPGVMRVEISNKPELYVDADKAQRLKLKVNELRRWYNAKVLY